MLRTLLRAAMTATLVVSLAACGGGEDSDADIQARVATQLEERGLDATTATCVAGVLIDEIGAKRIKDVNLSDTEPEPGLDDDIAAAAQTATATCNIDIAELDG